MLLQPLEGDLFQSKENVILFGVAAGQNDGPLVQNARKYWPTIHQTTFKLGDFVMHTTPDKLYIAVAVHKGKLEDFYRVDQYLNEALIGISDDNVIATVLMGCRQSGMNAETRHQVAVLEALDRLPHKVQVYYMNTLPKGFDTPQFAHLFN